ncbi:MAG: hypothetical protein WBL24_03370 [Kiritimatiellia bacterium]|jgi:hypothetical protein
MMRRVMVMMAVLALAATASVRAADGDGQLIQFKTGDVSFTLLQSDGVTPLAATELRMLSPEDGGVLAEAVSDQLGRAVIALIEGRYLLNVSGQNLSVLDVASDATLTSCRVVVPAAAMLVAGQEEEEDDDRGGAVWLKPVVIGGAVVFVAGAGYAIYDHNDDDDGDGDRDDDVLPPPPPPPPRPDGGGGDVGPGPSPI